jgi:hypothetical protein
MLHSPRRLKKIGFHLGENHTKVGVNNQVNYLRLIGANVTRLTFCCDRDSYQFKKVTEAFPNLKTLFVFQRDSSIRFNEKFRIANNSVKSLILHFTIDNYWNDPDMDEEPFVSFCKFVRFPDDCLEHFEIRVADCSFDYVFNRKIIGKFLANQRKLTEVVEGSKQVKGRGNCYYFEAKSKEYKTVE